MAKDIQYNSSVDSWLPPAALESKRWIASAKSSLFIAFPICLILGFYLAIVHSFSIGVTLMAISFLAIALILLNNPLIIKPLNNGKFAQSNTRLRIYCILGLICLVFPGVLYIISYLVLRDVFKPKTQAYPTAFYDAPDYPPHEFDDLSDLVSEDLITPPKQQ